MTPQDLPTYADWLDAAATRLARAGVDDSPRVDAEILLAAALERPRSHLVAWPERHMEPEPLRRADDWLARRASGEPVAHILGRREFWSLPLEVTADTLIPRPDTETLIEAALARFAGTSPRRIVDLGTGSGAIALALKSEFPAAEVMATDASPAALAVAGRNAASLGLDVTFREGRWWDPLAGEQFDLVVSNPPYVREDDEHLDHGDVRFEPRSALTAGPDGLDDIRHIVAGVSTHLASGGWILLEHGHDQAGAVHDILARAGLECIDTIADMGGNPRVTAGRHG